MSRHKPTAVTTPPRKALPPVPGAAPAPDADAPAPPPTAAPDAYQPEPSKPVVVVEQPVPGQPTPTAARPGCVGDEVFQPAETADPAPAPVKREHAPGARTIAAPAFIPADASRSDRKAAQRQARDIESDARQAEKDRVNAAWEAERAEKRAASYLPRTGATGDDAMRSYRKLKVQEHRATSEVLGGAYPFLAEAGLGSEGLYIGRDSWSGAGFCFDPWVLYERGIITNPNILLAGVIGRGKSTIAKCLATRSLAFGRRAYVPGDPKGEWTPVTKAVGGHAIELGGGLSTRLNPLDEGPRARSMSDEEWMSTVTGRRRDLLRALIEMSLRRPLGAIEATAVHAALQVVVADNSVPTLPMVVEAMLAPTRDTAGSTVEQLTTDGREAAHALNRLVAGDLSGLFDGPSTQTFDPSLPMVSLDLSRIQGNDELIALVMTCASTWMEAAISDPDGGQRWVIYDEAWRLLRNPTLLARMQSQWKLSRAWGIANLMIIHRLSDLDAVGDANSGARNLALGLLADCSTKIIYAQEAGEAEKTGHTIGLTAAEIAQLPNLDRGEGLWKIRDRAFMVRNTITAGELVLFDTNTRMVSP